MLDRIDGFVAIGKLISLIVSLGLCLIANKTLGSFNFRENKSIGRFLVWSCSFELTK